MGGRAGRLGGSVESGLAAGAAFRGRAPGVLGLRDSAVLELPEEEGERLMLEDRRSRLEERQARQRIEREIEEARRAREALEERIAASEAVSRSPRDPT